MGAAHAAALSSPGRVCNSTSAAYVQSWLRALKDDKRLIFKAASEAQKAAEWLMKGQQIEAEEKRAA